MSWRLEADSLYTCPPQAEVSAKAESAAMSSFEGLIGAREDLCHEMSWTGVEHIQRARKAAAGEVGLGAMLSGAWSRIFDCEQRCLIGAELSAAPSMLVGQEQQAPPWETLMSAIAKRDLDTLFGLAPRLMEQRVRLGLKRKPAKFWEGLDALVQSDKFRQVFAPQKSQGQWFFGLR